jgi:phosphoglycolate phosphatase-like HAD superfamily hydrolase
MPSPDSPRPYAAVDLDGVVADVRHRLHHLDARPKNWDGFFGEAPRDALLDEGAAVAARLAEDHDLVWLTGRPERCRRDTVEWLARMALPEGRLLMRRSGDRRPARVVKVDVLRRLAAEKPVDVLVDDDDQVVAAARAAGFTVLHADWMTEPARERLHTAQEQDGRT